MFSDRNSYLVYVPLSLAGAEMLGRGKVGGSRVTVPMSDAVGEFIPEVGSILGNMVDFTSSGILKQSK